MKYLAIALLFVSSALADSPKQWLDDYFSIVAARKNQWVQFAISKDPTLKEALGLEVEYMRAEEAMYRYLFVYHIEHATGLLKWEDGSWTNSITVCNCGEEGSVPTSEFKRLCGLRSTALLASDAKSSNEVAARIEKLLQDRPKGWGDLYRKRIADLRERFEAIVRQPNQRPEGDAGATSPSNFESIPGVAHP